MPVKLDNITSVVSSKPIKLDNITEVVSSPKTVTLDNITPQQQGPSLEGAAKQFGIGFGNELLLGAPLYGLKKIKGEEAVKKLESPYTAERIARGVGTFTGLVVGLPKLAAEVGIKGTAYAGRALLGAKKVQEANRFVKTAAKGIGAAVGYELAHAPEESFKEKVVTVPTAAIYGAGFGLAGEAIAPPIVKFLRSKGVIKGDVPTTENIERLREQVGKVKDDSIKLKISQKGNKLVADITDSQWPLRHHQENIIKANGGKTIPIADDINTQIKQYLGSDSIIRANFERYKGALRRLDAPIEYLDDYKRAMRSIERGTGKNKFKNPGDISVDEAKAAINDLKNILGPSKFANLENVAARQRGVLNRLLRKASETGIISEQSYKNMIAENKFYTPFEVLSYMDEAVDTITRGKGYNAAKAAYLKPTVGTQQKILDSARAESRYIMKMTSMIEKNLVKQRLVNLAKYDKNASSWVQSISKEGKLPEGFKKISLFKDGKKQEYAVSEELADVINGLNSKSIDIVTRFFGKFSGFLRAGATQYNVAFTVPNVVRDVVQAGLTSKYGFSPVDWGKGFMSALKKDRYFRQWMASGGGMSGHTQIMRKALRSAEPDALYRELVPSISDKVFNNLNPFKWLAEVNELTENATRVGVFRRALRSGASLREASAVSRDATIDFNKMGNIMQLGNLWIPFLNARIQGTLNLGSAVVKDPKRFSTAATTMIVVPQVLTHLNNTLRYPHVWENIRQFEKDNNFLFIFGDAQDETGKYTQVAKIPKGDAGKLIGNVVEDLMEFLRGNDPDYANMGSKFLSILSDVSPVDFEEGGQFSPSRLMSSVLPPPIKAGVEYATNVNLYTGREIVPKRLQNASAKKQFDIERTSPIAIELGQILNMSPLKIENMAGTLFGGVGRAVINPFSSPQIFTRRFSGVFGNQEQENQFNIYEDILQESADKKADAYNKAKLAVDRFNELPPDPDIKRNFLIDTFKNDPDGIEQFLALIKKEGSTELPIHRALKTLKVEDRLRFLQIYSATLDSDEDKLHFLESLFLNKVITEQGLKRIAK